MKATSALTLVPGEGTNLDTHVSTDAKSYAVATLVAALEDSWNAIRANHPEIPAAVVIVGPGTGNGRAVWGHFSGMRWQRMNDETRYSEIMVAGEGLQRPTADVLGTLLHEAAHALADARGIKDTSRQGRWHNKQFAKLANELGLTTEPDDKTGYATGMPHLTVERYGSTITALKAAITLFRHPEAEKPKKKRDNSNNPVALECACPRKIRVAPTVLEQGPITCDVCEHPFSDGQEEEQAVNRDYDPTGQHHNGVPTYPFRMAPKELLTRRQLAALNLRPGGQDVAAQIIWRRGKRVAYLYRIELAKPKRQATAAQLAALDRANTARRTCSTCTEVKPYTIPTRFGECLDCAGVMPS